MFDAELTRIILRAQAATIAKLTANLSFVRGKLLPSPYNRTQLRKLSQLFLKEMREQGFEDLVDAFVTQFSGQVKFFKEVLQQTLGKTDAAALGAVTLGAADRKFLAMSQADAATWIESVVDVAAARMRNKALLTVGGLTPERLANLVSTELGKTPGEARTIAATTISSFYRTLADISFRHVEADKNYTVFYRYVGPPSGDPVIRPFCQRMMEQVEDGTTWTREEIEQMRNGQLPDVFTTGGGYNCRHQWIVAQLVKNNAAKGASS